MRTNAYRKKTLVSKSEPKLTPVTRTLPPFDVVVDESDQAPESERPSKTLVISASDAEALRRIALLVPQTPVPESNAPRPSMPVRAAQATGRAAKATGRGAVLTSAVIGAVGLAGELVRVYHPDMVSIIGAIARAVAVAFGAQ